MKRWKKEDRELAVKALAEQADGMYVNLIGSAGRSVI
jgi:hypothetical protein